MKAGDSTEARIRDGTLSYTLIMSTTRSCGAGVLGWRLETTGFRRISFDYCALGDGLSCKNLENYSAFPETWILTPG